MEGCSPETCKILEAVAYFYQTYFRQITFNAIPRELKHILGDTAFGVIVRLVSGASSIAVPTMAKMMGVKLEEGDPLKALVKLNNTCHVEMYKETSKLKELGDIGLIPTEEKDGKIYFYLDKCSEDPIEMAPYVGIVVGISRALGLKVTAVKSEGAKKMVKEGYVVYPVPGKEKCAVVIEKAG